MEGVLFFSFYVQHFCDGDEKPGCGYEHAIDTKQELFEVIAQ